MSFVFIFPAPQSIFQEMNCKSMPNKYKKLFCCLFFCFAGISCTTKTNNDLPAYLPATQYSPVQQQYPREYAPNNPYSGVYTNPYAYPPRNYPQYYDYDQYYVPPSSYRGYEQERYYRDDGSAGVYNNRRTYEGSGGKY